MGTHTFILTRVDGAGPPPPLGSFEDQPKSHHTRTNGGGELSNARLL